MFECSSTHCCGDFSINIGFGEIGKTEEDGVEKEKSEYPNEVLVE